MNPTIKSGFLFLAAALLLNACFNSYIDEGQSGTVTIRIGNSSNSRVLVDTTPGSEEYLGFSHYDFFLNGDVEWCQRRLCNNLQKA